MRIFLILLCSIFANISIAQVKYIAHRGASSLAPENTLASTKLAWELGADMVECDIRLSKDHKIVVIHDGNTNRVSGKNYEVRNSLAKDLRKLDVGCFKGEKYKGEKIPYLKQLIRTTPKGKYLVVEIKAGMEILPYLQTLVLKTKKKSRLVFIAFNWETIVEAKRLFPENDCYYLSGSKKDILGKLTKAKEARLDGINVNHGAIDKEMVDLANKNGLDVWAWTVNDPQETKRLFNLVVKNITTDRPKWLKEQLGN